MPQIINTSATQSLMGDLNNHLELYGNIFPEYINLKKDAALVFSQLGIPSVKHEEWKYTNLGFVAKENFKFALPNNSSALSVDAVNQFCLVDNAIKVVIENGSINLALSNFSDLPKGLNIGPLADFTNHPSVVQHFAKLAPSKSEALVALNTAAHIDALVIVVDKNAEIAQPIEIVHVNHASVDASLVSSRVFIAAENNSNCTIIESYHSLDSTKSVFVNAVVEVFVSENATVNHVKLQNELDISSHVNFHQVLLKKNSNYHITTLTTGGKLVRNNLHLLLDGENVSAHLNGLYLGQNIRLVDNHSLVDHAMPNCFSSELYKGLLNDNSVGVFNGKVFVRKDAQKTNAYQSNKNVLLSDTAVMNTKPQLEIFADDVKCSHGATIGQINEEALFYLRARGIGEQMAKAMLNYAFAAEVIGQIKSEEIKLKLIQLLENKLNQ